MTFEEYESSINKVLSNPDTMLTEIKPIIESLKTDLETSESLRAEVEDLNNRVRDLQDTNMKLFLSQSGAPDEEEDEMSEEEKEVEAFFNALKEDI